MRPFSLFPATSVLIVVNVLVFVFTIIKAGDIDGAAWSYALVDLGAEFNPYTLGGQWYRIFAHMFLHGHFLHILLNMYALYNVGRELEPKLGTGKFMAVYFLSGVAAAMASLYFNLFQIGVGASGAIFGLFGVSLTLTIAGTGFRNSAIPILVNFALFLVINLALAGIFHADVAAHLGGLAAGILLTVANMFLASAKQRLLTEFVFAPVLLVIFFLLPRYQVDYFRFFQRVLQTEEAFNEAISASGLKDEDYLSIFETSVERWNTVEKALDSLAYVPEKLKGDTATLRRYIALRRLENAFKVKMIREESYIYRDSIDIVEDAARRLPKLDFPLVMDPSAAEATPPPNADPAGEMVRVWFDENWNEIRYPGPYYRIGMRDSLMRWQGRVVDYYANGRPQMKGSYKDDRKDGVFLYYSDHNTYTSAGRYVHNQNVGKWQIFHPNGRLEREEIFDGNARLKNWWDSTGFQLVKDGFGKFEQLDSLGNVLVAGEYANGLKQGTWFGRHSNGEMHFMEEYRDGYLVKGRARALTGEKFVYDQSSLHPHPEDGHSKLQAYLKKEAEKENSELPRTVKLAFRVTAGGVLSDFEIMESAGYVWDRKATEIVTQGPRWNPAKRYGYIPADGYAVITIEF